MRVVIQRVSNAKVLVDQVVVGSIERGLLVYAGFEPQDTRDDVEWICGKIERMRIFHDEAGKMNLDVNQVNGKLLIISQFTLHASTKKGNRPSFIGAADPEKAENLYEIMLEECAKRIDGGVQAGLFGTHMLVDSVNDGPVTICLDSKHKE